MEESELKQYYAIVTDYWRTFKTYIQIASDDDDWWTKVIQAVREMSAKYDNCPFALDMARTVINELERRMRGDKR